MVAKQQTQSLYLVPLPTPIPTPSTSTLSVLNLSFHITFFKVLLEYNKSQSALVVVVKDCYSNLSEYNKCDSKVSNQYGAM